VNSVGNSEQATPRPGGLLRADIRPSIGNNGIVGAVVEELSVALYESERATETNEWVLRVSVWEIISKYKV